MQNWWDNTNQQDMMSPHHSNLQHNSYPQYSSPMKNYPLDTMLNHNQSNQNFQVGSSSLEYS